MRACGADRRRERVCVRHLNPSRPVNVGPYPDRPVLTAPADEDQRLTLNHVLTLETRRINEFKKQQQLFIINEDTAANEVLL